MYTKRLVHVLLLRRCHIGRCRRVVLLLRWLAFLGLILGAGLASVLNLATGMEIPTRTGDARKMRMPQSRGYNTSLKKNQKR